MQVRCVFTNTCPTDAYRGAGRPEIAYTIERLLDVGAAQLGLTKDEIRRRNYIRADQMPYVNCVGNALDSGDFAGTQKLALDLAQWEGFAERRRAAEARGKKRGIGIGYFIEASGGAPQEWARLAMGEDGRAQLSVGTFSHGQGHETAFAQIVHSRLGIPFESVDLVQGDSLVIEMGGGTGGSRSSQMGGVATLRASDAVLAKARRIAAHLLEAGVADIELEDGRFRVAGTDLGVTWTQVVAAAKDPATLPAGETGGIEVKGPNVFKGYWRMPEKTADEFTTDLWFKTGDVGRIADDGFVTIVGRSKDLIITGGYNVYPAEVEGYLNDMPGVAESAVIGVPHADFGEAVVAVVVAQPGAALDAAAMVAQLKRRIANFKVPKQVFVVTELPRNAMGKVQKNLLREEHRGLFVR
jgi:acyl-CoA synthetase (AMP-forming)/AMP-acid ligase II